MQINKNSWHYKLWAKTYDYRDEPSSTDLCRYCHRVFWRLMVYLLLAVMSIYVIGMIGYFVFYQGLFHHTLLTLGIGAVIAVGITALVLYNRWLDGNKTKAEPATLVGQYLSASKQKVCPLVEFKE